jgi:hypothetical protein
MYANLVLTQQEPVAPGGGAPLQLGELCDGIFVEQALPTWLSFGGVAELCLEGSENGLYEVELRATDLETSETHVVKNWVLDIPSPVEGWRFPRTRVLPFAVEMGAYDELEMNLVLLVRGNKLAERAFAVRVLNLE